MANDYTIKPGDRVLTCCDERVGFVVRTGFFKKDNAPYPVENTWLIAGKAYDEVSAKAYESFESLVNAGNKYLAYTENKEDRSYLTKAESTYQGFAEGYIEAVDEAMATVGHKVTGNTIFNYLSEEFEGGFNYRDRGYKGDFLVRKNQIYSFFDSVWICYLLTKYDCYDDMVFDELRYMFVIYKNGGFDKYLYMPELDKAHIDAHIKVINDFFKQTSELTLLP